MNSISQKNIKYKEICDLAASSDRYFDTFKSNNYYREILEHTSYDFGSLYLNYIKQNFPEYSLYIDKFKMNDKFGNPEVYNYSDISSISPSTLRYIKVTGDIYNIFYKQKQIDLNNKKIIEIGCGYGGQCFLLSQIFNFDNYYIVDIPESQKLIHRYLNRLDTKHTIISIDDVKNLKINYDLVISNYAYSELDKEFQDYYYDYIISRSDNGYLTLNFISDIFNIDSYKQNDLLQKIDSHKKIFILEENPKTFNNNIIIYF